MTGHRSKREIERALEELEDDVEQRDDDTQEYDRDPLTTEEKEELAEMFDIDSEDMYGPSENDALAELHERFS